MWKLLLQMKKILGKLYNHFFCILICFICLQNLAYSYETVLIDFPNGGWHKVFYENRDQEAIVQFVPSGQTKASYLESVIFHSYKKTLYGNVTPESIFQYHIRQAMKKDRSIKMSYTKVGEDDTMAIWCSKAASQCEIVRTAQGYEGIIVMHYINNNPQYFQSICPNWVNIMKQVKIYYSYYRWNSTMNKANSVEL